MDARPVPATPTGFACASNAWQRYRGELRGYLVRRTSDPQLAEDLLQDVFLRAMRQGEAFCALRNVRAWLFQVARNAWVDHVRLRKATVPLPEELADAREPMAPVDELAGCMERSLSGLSAEDREILRSCDLEGMKLRAYADAHGLTLPGVKSRIQRARRRVREVVVRNCGVRFDEHGRVCCHVGGPG